MYTLALLFAEMVALAVLSTDNIKAPQSLKEKNKCIERHEKWDFCDRCCLPLLLLKSSSCKCEKRLSPQSRTPPCSRVNGSRRFTTRLQESPCSRGEDARKKQDINA